MTPYRHLLALGDSIIVDDYPGDGYGAAALLYRNQPEFGEFDGRDLRIANPTCRYTNLGMDGATVGLMADFQLPEMPDGDDAPDLVVLTAGGNDFMPMFGASEVDGRAAMAAVVAQLGVACARIADRAPDARLLLGTIYDPSDGTGELAQMSASAWPSGQALFAEFNEAIRALADTLGATLVDIHQHFLGHGRTAGDVDAPAPGTAGDDCWYCCTIHPNRAGASEVRRLWLDALEAIDAIAPEEAP